MKIGIFDSGVGGLTVLKEALRVLPGECYLYYADSANVPYGTKEKETVRRYIFDGVAFMASQGVKALVIACNTATSIAAADLRREYSFPILGMEPAVKPAISKCAGKRVLVLATALTLKEEKFINLVGRLDSDNLVDSLPLPGLVDFAEALVFDRGTVLSYLRKQFAEIDTGQYGTVVLGCTHFPYYRNLIRELFPAEAEIIDGNSGTVRYLARVLEEKGMLAVDGRGATDFYTSGGIPAAGARFERCLKMLD
jgi:glutamate racemase